MRIKITILLLLLSILGFSQSYVQWWNVQQEIEGCPELVQVLPFGSGAAQISGDTMELSLTSMTDGNLMIVHAARNESSTFSLSGWTTSSSRDGTGLSTTVFYKIKTSSDTIVKLISSANTTTNLFAALYEFSGADQTTPTSGGGNVGEYLGLSYGTNVTTTTNYSLGVLFWATRDDSPSASFSGTGWDGNSLRYDSSNIGISFMHSHKCMETAGSTGVGTFTFGGTRTGTLSKMIIRSE